MTQITSIDEWVNKYIKLREQIGAQIEVMEAMQEAVNVASCRLKEINFDIERTVDIMKEAVGYDN